MVLSMRSLLVFEIFSFIKTSAPKRIGTRTNELFLNLAGLPFSSIILEIKSLTALDPMSIAAYFCMVNIV